GITTADGATSRLARQVSFAAYGRVATDPDGVGIAYSAPTGPCRSHAGIHLDEQPDDPGSGTTPLTGTCAIGGTDHPHTIWGTALGGDVIRAGAGDDVVHANNARTDKIDCGPGRDTVYADREDWTRRCERVL